MQVGDSFAYNCVPPVAKCSLDIRISPHVEPKEISDMLDKWCEECSINEVKKVTWKNILGMGPTNNQHALTATDSSNPWYQVFESAMATMGHNVNMLFIGNKYF